MDPLEKRFPIYARLLRLYPTPFRNEYYSELLQTAADMLDNASSQHEELHVWLSIAKDFPLSIGYQQLHYAGEIALHETPEYMKRTGLISMLLLVPFFVVILANSIDVAFNHVNLQSTELWSPPVLSIWILILPGIAVLLVCGSYLAFVTKSHEIPFWKHAFQVKHVWPVVVPGILALGILGIIVFHDSGQCWLHNPIHAIGNLGATMHCTTQNAAFTALHTLIKSL